MTSITEIRKMYNEGMKWNSLLCGNHFVIEYQPDRDLAIVTYLYVSGYMINSPDSVTYFVNMKMFILSKDLFPM